MIAVKSDTICKLRTRRDVLILHHNTLKICQARKRQSGYATIRSVYVSSKNPQARNRNRCHWRKTTNVAKGPWYRRPIFRLMPCSLGLGAGLGLSQKLRNSFRHRRASSARDQVANANGTSIVCLKTKTSVGLMVQCEQCKDWFHPVCVGWGDKEVRELSTYYCADCILVIE